MSRWSICLFVEGVYVGEAYCTQFMGQRVSEWEATAQRKHDREKAKAAASATQQVRSGMQEEIEATREREYGRQLDRQREDMHPSQVLSELEALRQPPPSRLRLPEAKPDPEKEYPVRHLAIRPTNSEETL